MAKNRGTPPNGFTIGNRARKVAPAAEGRLRSHEWDGKDGLRRYTTEVVMDQMKMLSPKTDIPVENGQPVAEPVGA